MATTFYKPDPNNPTLYNTQNQPVSYNEYKTQGGLGIEGGGGWTDVISGPVPTQAAITTYNPTTGTGGLQMPSIVTSTTGTQNNIKNLDTGITNAQNQSVGLADLLKLFQPQDTSAQDAASTKFLADRQAQLDKRQADEIARLTAEYSTEKARTETQQATDLAPIDRRLQLLHDTTVGPNAQLEEQLTLQRDKMLQANKLELEHLYNTRENFIAQARTSFEDQDFKLAESQMKQAKDAQQQIYERSKDAMSMALSFAQEARQQQTAQLAQTKDLYEQQKDARDFTMKYGINQPLFSTGNTIFNSQTLQPEYENIAGTFKRLSDGKIYGSEKEFFADSGLSSFNQIQNIAEGSGTEQKIVLDLINDFPDARIYPGDSLDVAYDKLNSSKIYRDRGDKDTPPDLTITETYAQDVFSGTLKLTSVPAKIRSRVSERVKELQSSQYDTEFEARVDYNQEINALRQAKNDNELAGKPSEIITALMNVYGSKISRQEMEATIYNLFGISK